MTSLGGVLAIDAGQTGMKVRILGLDGAHDEVFAGIRTHEALLPQLAAVVRAALASTGLPVHTVTAGVSGLTTKEADAAALLSLLEGTGVREVLLAHDSTTSYLGAMGDARGAVVAAGTGVVTLAVGQTRVARVDGWGNLVGDAGSGYWIGREALDAVMRSFDGRGPETALRAVAEDRWPDLTAAYIALQSAADRVSIIASFAESVAALALDGDDVARRITDAAASELAHSAETALRLVRTSPDETLGVCTIGGVFRSAPLAAAFAECLRRSGLHVARRDPLGHGIDGAVALATLPPGHPLASDISAARTSSPAHVAENSA